MPSGVLVALVAYTLFSCCDAIIKSFSGELTVFQIGFFTTLFSLIPALISKPRSESWREICCLRHPWRVQLRAVAGLLGSTCVIYAFTHIPLAEVYSIGFLTPLFLVCLSSLLLKEEVSRYRWVLVITGFIGVLIVVRPGFQALEAGHFAALGGAVCAAISTLTLRSVSADENRLSIFAIVVSFALAGNGVMMVVQGAPLPTLDQLLRLAFIGTLGGIGHLSFIAATKLSPANHIAPTQYSQLGWAILFGSVFYGEYPDAIGLIGLGVVLTAGLLNIVPPDRCVAVISRFDVALSPVSAGRRLAKRLATRRGAAKDNCPPPLSPAPAPEL
jgi:drug/metabolite transporter (DMT)-like permease